MSYAVVGAIFVIIAVIVVSSTTRHGAIPLPPGPRPIPFLGNILDLKLKEFWLDVTQFGHTYGDIVCLYFFGRKIIYLNTAEVAFDLLDKRGSIYSDKPRMVMAGELCGCDRILPFTNYGDSFRRQRKLMQTSLGNKEIPNYYQWLNQQTHTFIRHLVQSPSEYTKHIRRYAGGLTLAVVYGYHVTSSNDEYLMLAEECLDLLSNRISGGGLWLVDIFPFLKYIPSWLPGASFKSEAEVFRRKYEKFAEAPYRYAKIASEHQRAEEIRSFCATLLQDQSSGPLTKEIEDDIKWTANSMYAASADTTIAVVSHFILAMIKHPDVFKKAQKELDEVVPRGRLPTFADRKSLPYAESIFKETLRWGVPVPLNLPHNVREDNVYQGLLIPKDSIVIANIWAIMRDESLYNDAHSFNPERFMDCTDAKTERKRDPSNYAFGFGRRRCPGADLVDSSIWLLIVSMIAALDINSSATSDGTHNPPQVSYDNTFFRIPNFFEFNVELRDGYRLD